jgi:hypothetical protein
MFEETIDRIDLVACHLADALEDLDNIKTQSRDTLGRIILEDERRNKNEKH